MLLQSIQKLEKEPQEIASAVTDNKNVAGGGGSSHSTSPAKSPQTDSERIEDTLLDVREKHTPS